MDKLARTESSPRRTTREERPAHPCTRDLVFSLATCGSLFVLGSWSLTAVGCSAQAKTNEQRTAQRRNASPSTPLQTGTKKVQMEVTGVDAVEPTSSLSSSSVSSLTSTRSATNQTSKKKLPWTILTAMTEPEQAIPATLSNGNVLASAFTKRKYGYTDTAVAARTYSPTPANAESPQGQRFTQTSSNGGSQVESASAQALPAFNAALTTNTSATNIPATAPSGNNAWSSKTAATTANGSQTGTSTTELSRMLADAFAANTKGTMDPMRVWFIYASLAASNPDIQLPEGWSQDLVPAERDRVIAAHAGFAALGRSLRDGATAVDSATRQALVAALTGEPALAIPRVDLCSKVVGYGDYSPIGRRNFLVGSNSRVIVYSELDGFKSSLENGKWTTRLATRVSIVASHGNTPTWCRTPEWTEVVDTADKLRNEFFLGEIIPINANLAMGNYVVRVEVKDLTTGATTSSIVPFKVLDKQAFAAAGDNGETN